MEPILIDSGTFPSDSIYFFSGPIDEFKDFWIGRGYSSEKVENLLSDSDRSHALTFNFSDGNYGIWFSELTLNPEQLSILAHECFHLTEMIFQRIGIVHDFETSSEAFAYQIQHFAHQILNHFLPEKQESL